MKDAWDRLVDKGNDLGWSVVFVKSRYESLICPESRTIQIARRLSRERRIFDLAHELGHVLCGHRWRLEWPHNELGEEYTAWDAGRALLRRMRISIDPFAWERHKALALRGHMKTVLSRPTRVRKE